MKFTLFFTLLLLIACTTPKPEPAVDNRPPVEKKDVEGAIASKKIPDAIRSFKYVPSVNAYFRNDVIKSAQDRIISKIKGNKALKDDKSRFSRQVEPKASEFVNPIWSEYFGDKRITGTYQLNIRVGKDGTPDVIVVKKGISKEADRVFVKYVSKYPFYPAIHKKSKKPVRAWFPFRTTFAVKN